MADGPFFESQLYLCPAPWPRVELPRSGNAGHGGCDWDAGNSQTTMSHVHVPCAGPFIQVYPSPMHGSSHLTGGSSTAYCSCSGKSSVQGRAAGKRDLESIAFIETNGYTYYNQADLIHNIYNVQILYMCTRHIGSIASQGIPVTHIVAVNII